MQTLTKENTIHNKLFFHQCNLNPVIMDNTVQYGLWWHFISEFALIQSWSMTMQTNQYILKHCNHLPWTDDWVTVIHNSCYKEMTTLFSWRFFQNVFFTKCTTWFEIWTSFKLVIFMQLTTILKNILLIPKTFFAFLSSHPSLIYWTRSHILIENSDCVMNKKCVSCFKGHNIYPIHFNSLFVRDNGQ